MKKLFIVSGLCLLLAGCSIFPKPQTPQVNYFSIGVPSKQLVKKRIVKVQTVNSLIGYTTAMRFKTTAGKVEVDQFNRWISSPATQIQRYLTIAMAPEMSGVAPREILTIATQLLTFENNLSHEFVILTLLVTVKEKNKVKYEQLFTEKINVSGANAAAYANAMSIAMNKIAVKVAAKINSLK
ncbi:MAG: ABC-type transport auxiliary lipoprotein family protein [Victivallaceae bacterium]|nr:ABC-type transport auxiliary lipoprotein family protein [Victivallaceae bacterium]